MDQVGVAVAHPLGAVQLDGPTLRMRVFWCKPIFPKAIGPSIFTGDDGWPTWASWANPKVAVGGDVPNGSVAMATVVMADT